MLTSERCTKRHKDELEKEIRGERLKTLRPSTQVQSVGVWPMKASGTVIVIDRVPEDPAQVFFECRPIGDAMVIENSVLENCTSPLRTFRHVSGGGGNLQRGDATNSVPIIGGLAPTAVWRVQLGNVVFIRDSKPSGGAEPFENILGSLFNNDFRGDLAYTDSVGDVRHGDILAVPVSGNIDEALSQEPSSDRSDARAIRVFVFVEEQIRRVKKVLRRRDRVATFRANFNRFFSNLSVPAAFDDTETKNVTLLLNTQQNDADLKNVRETAFLQAIGTCRWFSESKVDDPAARASGRRNNDLISTITGLL